MVAENGYDMEELMQFAGHGGNPRIYFSSYMSSTSSVQVVGNIPKLKCREDLAEPFSGLTLQRHPQLWQALPAKLRQDLEDSAECKKLNDQTNELSGKIGSTSSDEQRQESQAQRNDLHQQKKCLVARVLEDWRKRLPEERKPGIAEEDDHTLSCHWTWFKAAFHSVVISLCRMALNCSTNMRSLVQSVEFCWPKPYFKLFR